MSYHDLVPIGEAARAAGISVKMAQHYKAIGIVSQAERASGGIRLFRLGDVYTLRFIALASMKHVLQELIDACAGDGRPDRPIVEDLADVRRHLVRSEAPTLEVSPN